MSPRAFPYVAGLALLVPAINVAARRGARRDAPAAPSRPTADTVENFALLDQDGTSHELYRQAGAQAVVLISYSRGCPIARASLPAIRELKERFGKSVRFFLLDPVDDAASIALEAREFGIDLPALHDETQVVSSSLGIERTAEALLIRTGDWRVAYRGPIDDRSDYGFSKDTPGAGYLRDAILALPASASPAERKAQVKGCLIRYEKPLRPTYATDVGPILKARCIACHAAGRLSWAMTGHESVSRWAPMIRETVLTGRMPPWSLDRGRSIDVQSEFALTPREIRVLAEWAAAGAPRGEGADPLSRIDGGSVLEPSGDPDLSIRLPRQTLDAGRAGQAEWRFEILTEPFPEDRWVRQARLVPGNRSIVSHMRLFALPQGFTAPRRAKRSIQAMRFDHSIVATWAPGLTAPLLPEDQGVLIPKGSRLAARIHYKKSGKPESDQPSVRVFYHRSKPRWRVRHHTVRSADFVIPPRAHDHRVRAERMFADGIVLRGVGFHMHARGSGARCLAVLPDGRQIDLLAIPRFDTNWTWGYVFKEPLRLPAGTRIRIEGVFDNSDRNPRNPDPSAKVTTGLDAMTEEMFYAYLSVLEPA
ncbi:MAG: redoxin domain-containing protein [Elusimicrobia bacterium]|nr:redoxin domain-containing protein [Elusimicrobiota bacterium]